MVYALNIIDQNIVGTLKHYFAPYPLYKFHLITIHKRDHNVAFYLVCSKHGYADPVSTHNQSPIHTVGVLHAKQTLHDPLTR